MVVADNLETSDDANATIETVLEDFEVFDIRDVMNVVAYSAMSSVGMVLNTMALVAARRQSARPDVRSRTNVHYLVFHLTLADTITSYITMPMETFWRLFIGWYAGNLMCKVLMMIRTGGYILSSLLLVVLSIDRYISISDPFSSLNLGKQRKRARAMVVSVWILTLVFASPQAIIFRLLKHPVKDFYQCTTFNFFENLSTPVVIDNVTHSLLLGLTPVQWADLYHSIFNCEIFFIPLIIIVGSYVKIYFILTRRNAEMTLAFPPSTDYNLTSQMSYFKSNRAKKSVMKALKMSMIHVVAFVLSWTPYTIMATWDTIDKNSASQVPGAVQDILYLTAVLNSCVNPLIYGAYYYSEKNTRRGQASIRLQTTSFRSVSHTTTSPRTARMRTTMPIRMSPRPCDSLGQDGNITKV